MGPAEFQTLFHDFKRVDKISLKKNVSGSIGNKDSLGINLFQQVFTCQLLQRQSKKSGL